MKNNITLNEDTEDILAKLAVQTGLSIGAIVDRLLAAHLGELHEIDAFLKAHSPGPDSLHEQGVNLLQSYGPESIIDGITRIAPNWETLAIRFDRELGGYLGQTRAKSK